MNRLLAALLAIALAALAGCASDKKTFRTYTKEGAAAETTQRSTDAEGFYVSAVERARKSLGPKEQSEALYNLGAFYRKQTRYKDAVGPLIESVALGIDAGSVDELGLGRRYAELARSYAALNRWSDGAAVMRNVVPLQDRFPADEAKSIAELAQVYKTRLPELGLDASFLR